MQKQLSDTTADPGEKTNVADRYPEVVSELSAAYDQWWKSIAPFQFNEGLPMIPGEKQPFNLRYDKQLKEKGIPEWSPSAD